LIFHPNYSVIENNNLTNFNNKELDDFVIVKGDDNAFYKNLLNNSDLRSLFVTKDLNNVIYVQDPASNLDVVSFDEANITFNCSISKDPFSLEIVVYSFKNSKFVNTGLTLFDFPGCYNNEENINYKIPISKLTFPNNSIIQLRNANDRIASFSFAYTNPGYFVSYLNVPDEKLVYEKLKGSSILQIYSDGITKSVQIEKPENTKSNLSEEINNLMLDNVLPNPFRIWSSYTPALIKNAYVD